MLYLNPVDAAFLRMESKRTPMHVAGLVIFRLPEGASKDYLRELFAFMKSQPVVTPPYTYRVAKGRRLGRLAPMWEEAPNVDLDYHMRHSALPHPGGERELGVLVSRLHSNPLDMSKPLWETHLIEGLENNRFALYLKAHHAAVDGITALKLMNRWLSDSPDDATAAGPWAVPQPEKPPSRRPSRNLLRYGSQLANEQVRAAAELGGALRKMIRTEKNPDGGMASPLDTPRTMFNGRITQHRRLATQIFDLDRFKAMSTATGYTINDLCLAICGAALRRYLIEQDALPDKPLVASVPVGLPRPDGKPGNRTAGFVCPIGTDIDDPIERLQHINATTTQTKAQMQILSDAALGQFSVLGITPLMLGQLSPALQRMPPLFNVTISNVPGSRTPKYFRGAEMEALFPVSVLFDGYTLNMTIVGYADRLTLGVVGCRETIPNLQRIAVYAGEALDELEAAIANTPAPRRRKSTAKRAVKS